MWASSLPLISASLRERREESVRGDRRRRGRKVGSPKHSQYSPLREVGSHLGHHLEELGEGQNPVAIVIAFHELLLLNRS
jgi:hypothetical protein